MSKNKKTWRACSLRYAENRDLVTWNRKPIRDPSPQMSRDAPVLAYLDNLHLTVHPTETDCDGWILEHVYGDTPCSGVGFDTESLAGELALVQIATPRAVLVLRVYGLASGSAWPVGVLRLLAERRIAKFAVDTRQDLCLLARAGVRCANFVDLQQVVSWQWQIPWRVGMQALALHCLGLAVAKKTEIRAGDWSALPLSEEQVQYAAADSVVCLALAEALGLVDARHQPRLVRAQLVAKSLGRRLRPRKRRQKRIVTALARLVALWSCSRNGVARRGWTLEYLAQVGYFKRCGVSATELAKALDRDSAPDTLYLDKERGVLRQRAGGSDTVSRATCLQKM